MIVIMQEYIGRQTKRQFRTRLKVHQKGRFLFKNRKFVFVGGRVRNQSRDCVGKF